MATMTIVTQDGAAASMLGGLQVDMPFAPGIGSDLVIRGQVLRVEHVTHTIGLGKGTTEGEYLRTVVFCVSTAPDGFGLEEHP